MRCFWVVLICLTLATLAGAESYSCRDSQGRLHFSDNLASLPKECLGRVETLNPAEENLNIVPATKVPPTPPAAVDPQRELRQARQQEQNRKLYTERAEALVKQYQEAQQTRRAALRSWSYDSRKVIKEAEEKISRVRQDKKELLEMVSDSNLYSGQKKNIREILQKIDSGE